MDHGEEYGFIKTFLCHFISLLKFIRVVCLLLQYDNVSKCVIVVFTGRLKPRNSLSC